MTLVPLVVAAVGAALLSWAARDSHRTAVGIGLLGLVLVAVLSAVLADPAASGPLGGEAVALDDFGRLFLGAATVTGLLLSLLTVTLPRPPMGLAGAIEAAAPDPAPEDINPAPGFLLFAGAAALALGIVSPLAALLPAAAGGVAAFFAVRRPSADVRPRGGRVDEGPLPDDPRTVARRLGLDVLRTAIALGLAVTAVELLAGRGDPIAGDPFGVGAASVALALAVALRFGAVPMHVHEVRLIQYVERGAVPVLAFWGPALFALVALAGQVAAVLPLGLPLGVERGLIAGLGLLTLVTGGIGALVQDDLDHAIAYWVLQDAGLVLFAFAAGDVGVWGPARAWLLILPVAKSALLAWSLTIGRTFGTRSLLELRGWARRAPLLAVAFAAVTVATIGVPGLASWDARLGLVRGAFSDPLRTLVVAGSLSGALVALRLLLVGFDRPTSIVQGGPDERLRRPAPDLRRRVGSTAQQMVDLNRVPLAAGIVALLALATVALGAGMFGLRAAASNDRPAPLPAGESTPVPAPTFAPVSTDAPSASPSPRRTPSPTAVPTRSPAPTKAPSASPRPTRT